MHAQLDPAVTAKLDAFRVRRQRLIFSRGICALLVSTVLAFILVVLADWLLFLPESVLFDERFLRTEREGVEGNSRDR